MNSQPVRIFAYSPCLGKPGSRREHLVGWIELLENSSQAMVGFRSAKPILRTESPGATVLSLGQQPEVREPEGSLLDLEDLGSRITAVTRSPHL